MISELQYIDYFTQLAINHKSIAHVPGTKDAFFFIPLTYDLAEIDSAVRNTKSAPFMALDAMRGKFNDYSSENNVQLIDGQITILDKIDKGKLSTIREAQDKCFKICFDLVTRMKSDRRKGNMFGNNLVNFSISNISYDPVGPMAINHYGYTIRFQIACPFGYTVDSGTWLDK